MKTEAPYREIYNDIAEAIEKERLRPGEKLSGERAMARSYDTTRATVQYALKALEKDGYVCRVQGKGTFVAHAYHGKLDLGMLSDNVNGGMTSMVTSTGGIASSKVLTRGVIKARFFAHRLELEEDAPVYVLHRVRLIDGEPVALEYTYVPAELFGDIDEINFAHTSLYDYMDTKGMMPKNFNERVQIIEVNERERSHLELKENDPVYYCEVTSYDSNGRVVEYTEAFARCDKFEMNFETGNMR